MTFGRRSQKQHRQWSCKKKLQFQNDANDEYAFAPHFTSLVASAENHVLYGYLGFLRNF
jgi:hypothetical protein